MDKGEGQFWVQASSNDSYLSPSPVSIGIMSETIKHSNKKNRADILPGCHTLNCGFDSTIRTLHQIGGICCFV